MSTHPDPGNRIQYIESWLKEHATGGKSLRK
jgi:Zn-dependent protease with chaperone function